MAPKTTRKNVIAPFNKDKELKKKCSMKRKSPKSAMTIGKYREYKYDENEDQLKKKGWELSVLCDVMVFLAEGKVAKEKQEEVKSILVEYCPKKRVLENSDCLEITVKEIKKRTMDIDRNWVSSEETRDMWRNSLESQLKAVIDKTGAVEVKDKETALSDMRESMTKIERSLLVTAI